MKELILGGSRSGKSTLAEQRAAESGCAVTYLATATAGDEEMAARIAQHRARRPEHWNIVEEPLRLAQALQRHAAPERCLLVDCLTLWLTNLLCANDEELFRRERAAFVEVLPTLPGRIILVSNEVGMGIVPMGELSRRFSDEAGWLNQDVARLCERVTLMVAGLPYPLKLPTS
jgi:adenosylcobinamide kinase/adenosylcobinamide-phosphate guanylyltransferase